MHLNICGTTASGNLVAVLPRPPPSDQFHTPSKRQPFTCRPYSSAPPSRWLARIARCFHLGNGTDMEVSQPRRQHGAST